VRLDTAVKYLSHRFVENRNPVSGVDEMPGARGARLSANTAGTFSERQEQDSTKKSDDSYQPDERLEEPASPGLDRARVSVVEFHCPKRDIIAV
jgi:hypothetical protein